MHRTTYTAVINNFCPKRRLRAVRWRSVQRHMIGLSAASSSSGCCCFTKTGHSPPPAVAESVQSKGYNNYHTSSPCDRHIVHHLYDAGTLRSPAQACVLMAARSTPWLLKMSTMFITKPSQLLATAATHSRQLVWPCRHQGLTGSTALSSLRLVRLASPSCSHEFLKQHIIFKLYLPGTLAQSVQLV